MGNKSNVLFIPARNVLFLCDYNIFRSSTIFGRVELQFVWSTDWFWSFTGILNDILNIVYYYFVIPPFFKYILQIVLAFEARFPVGFLGRAYQLRYWGCFTSCWACSPDGLLGRVYRVGLLTLNFSSSALSNERFP